MSIFRSAAWIVGRKPYRPIWKAFGFDADKQIKSSLGELVSGIAAAGGTTLPAEEELARAEETAGTPD
jgi:hypothetical protein